MGRRAYVTYETYDQALHAHGKEFADNWQAQKDYKAKRAELKSHRPKGGVGVSIVLTPQQYMWLLTEAERVGASVSTIARQVIDLGVASYKPTLSPAAAHPVPQFPTKTKRF